jgi:endonuclease-3
MYREKMEKKLASMKKSEIEGMFGVWSLKNPEPRGELHYTNIYTLLVAVVLSAQATDKGVNKCTVSLFERVETPWAMLELGEEGLKEYIRYIGLYHTKAKNVIKMAGELIERHGGEVPRERGDLEKLSGVGRKTANVVLNVGFGESTLAVDTHIFRLGNRMGLAKGKTPLEVERGLLKVIPPCYLRDAHHWLILHGRYVCTARSPKCDTCDVYEMCGFEDKAEESRKRGGMSG